MEFRDDEKGNGTRRRGRRGNQLTTTAGAGMGVRVGQAGKIGTRAGSGTGTDNGVSRGSNKERQAIEAAISSFSLSLSLSLSLAL